MQGSGVNWIYYRPNRGENQAGGCFPLKTGVKTRLIGFAILAATVTAAWLAMRSQPPAIAEPASYSLAAPDLVAVLDESLPHDVHLDNVALDDAVDLLLERLFPANGWDGPAGADQADAETIRSIPPSTQPAPKLSAGIFIDRAGLQKAGVGPKTRLSFNSTRTATIRGALAAALAKLPNTTEPIRCEVIGHVVFISTEQRLALFRRLYLLDQRLPDSLNAMLQLDRQMSELRFDNVGFADVMDFLRDVTGQAVFIDWKSLDAGVDHNAPITLRLTNMPLRQALRLILIQAAADGPPIEVGIDPDSGVIEIGRSPKERP